MLFIASIDNGSDDAWVPPDDFHVVREKYFGTDGQTFIVAWHVATATEPAVYSKPYGGTNIVSAAAVISLISITGADTTFPVNTHDEVVGSSPSTTVVASSNGVTTTTPGCLLIYAAGADWLSSNGSNTFDVPAGFTALTTFGDNGDNTWQWTSQMVAAKFQPDAGASGLVTGTITSTIGGIPWTSLLAISPAAL